MSGARRHASLGPRPGAAAGDWHGRNVSSVCQRSAGGGTRIGRKLFGGTSSCSYHHLQPTIVHYICAAPTLSNTHLLRVRVRRRLNLRGHRGLGLGLLHSLPRPARLPGHQSGAEEREEEEAGEVRPHGVRITSPPVSRRKQGL